MTPPLLTYLGRREPTDGRRGKVNEEEGEEKGNWRSGKGGRKGK